MTANETSIQQTKLLWTGTDVMSTTSQQQSLNLDSDVIVKQVNI